MNQPSEPQSLPHYREYLEREFQLRQRRNAGYSLRAFARDLGMQPSKLSEVLRGLRGLSRKTAAELTRRIRMSEEDADAFITLIDLHQTKSPQMRERAKEKFESRQTLSRYNEINLQKFKVIADWHHFAILELTETRDFVSDASWIANRLGLSSEVAEDAIKRLIEFELLERGTDGSLRQTQKNLATPSGIPSREIREHHSQILNKAEATLFDVDVEERDFSAITLAFDPEQMDEVREEIKKFRRRLSKIIEARESKERVYCLSVQFFPMDQKKEN